MMILIRDCLCLFCGCKWAEFWVDGMTIHCHHCGSKRIKAGEVRELNVRN